MLTICICSLLSPQKPILNICLDIKTIPNLQNFAASRRTHWFWHSIIRYCLWKISCGRKLQQFDINVFDLFIHFNSFYNKFPSKDVLIKNITYFRIVFDFACSNGYVLAEMWSELVKPTLYVNTNCIQLVVYSKLSQCIVCYKLIDTTLKNRIWHRG